MGRPVKKNSGGFSDSATPTRPPGLHQRTRFDPVQEKFFALGVPDPTGCLPPRTESDPVPTPVQENVSGGKKRGRPSKKQVIGSQDSQVELEVGPVDGVESLKRRSGKLARVAPAQAQTQHSGPDQVVVRRRPGRPPRNLAHPNGSDQVVVKKRPGRPPRIPAQAQAKLSGCEQVVQEPGKRGRCTRSGLGPVLRANGKQTRVQPPGAAHGRVPKVSGPTRVGRPSACGKSRGRPRKNAATPKQSQQMANKEPANNTVHVNAASYEQVSQQQAIEDPTTTAQQVIREALVMLRPYLPQEKFQEVEQLLNAPPQAVVAPPVMAKPRIVHQPMPLPFQVPCSFNAIGTSLRPSKGKKLDRVKREDNI